MHTEFAHVPSSFLSKTRDHLFFLLRPTPPLAFWILPHCIYSENLPVDYAFSILCSEAQASIIFPLTSQPPPITKFFSLHPQEPNLKVSSVFFNLHFLPTTKSSAQNSTNNIPWKQLSLKLTIIYKWLSPNPVLLDISAAFHTSCFWYTNCNLHQRAVLDFHINIPSCLPDASADVSKAHQIELMLPPNPSLYNISLFSERLIDPYRFTNY